MTKPKYSYLISITEIEQEEVNLLRKQGKKIVDIFRDGLKLNLRPVPKNLKRKAKELING